MHLFRSQPFRLLKWLVALVVPAVLWAGWNSTTILEYSSIQSLRNQNRVEVAQLEEELETLKREKEALDDDAGYPLEKAIRERMIMRRPGEEILTIREGNLVTPRHTEPITRDENLESPSRFDAVPPIYDPVSAIEHAPDPLNTSAEEEPVSPFESSHEKPFLFDVPTNEGRSIFED